jgi:hypothetical protein
VTWWLQVSVRTSRVALQQRLYMVSAGHSAIRKRKALPGHQRDVIHQCCTPMLSHLCDPVPSGYGVHYSRVAPHSEYLHGECWSLSNQETTKLAWVIKECYTSVLHAFWCGVICVTSGCRCSVHTRVLRRNTTMGECWSLSNQEATKLYLGHQRNVIHQCYMPSVESFV